ncbi:uncharacterized protein LOC120343292 [Styela clava]
MIFLVVLFLVICQVGATLKIDAYEGYAYIANFSCNRDQELVTRTVQIGRVQSPCYDGTSINYPKELTSGFKLVDITFDSVYIYGYRLTILDFQLASSDRLYIGSGTEKDGLNTLAIRNVTFTSSSTTDGLIYVQDVEDGPIVDVLNLAGRNTYDLQNYETAIMDFYTVDDTIEGRGFLIDYEADINKCLYTGADIYCMNGGTCSRTGFNTASCACTPAWTGSRCETDVNECDTTSPKHNCDANANCAKLDGGFTCTCKTGFTGNGTHCEDINECPDGVNTHLCALTGTCANKPGGYDCTCNIGYENGTYGPCSNINECSRNTDNCDTNADCADTVGSFTCACKTFYTGNGTTCVDIDECAMETHACGDTGTCVNKVGGYNCSCNPGYEGGIGGPCTDIKECNSPTTNACSAQADCTDTIGSYVCVCKTGYTGDGKTCNDINECTSNTHICHDKADCTNNNGSFTCTCKTGYTGTGTICTDINECAIDTDNCHNNAKCTNNDGSFTCACETGFTGDGFNCADNDECTLKTDNCHSNATCGNTFGSFTCTCQTGYTGNGIECTDQNECDTRPCDTNAACTNNEGSFACECNSGFTGNGFTCTVCNNTDDGYTCSCNDGFTGDGYNCSDVDECMTDNKCHSNAQCINTIGSYECKCMPGYTGNGNNCNDINECEILRNWDNCQSYGSTFDCHCTEGLSGWGEYGSTDQYLTYTVHTYDNVTCPRLLYNCSFENDRCQCSQTLREINTYCFKVDQCTLGQHDCDENATCIDSANGTYACQCKEGFTGNGFNCNDINECENEILPCSNCSNTNGGYSCGCKEGFGGGNCTDIDECQTGKHNCHPRAKCTNTYGSYNCTCAADYYVEGDNGTWCSGCPGDSWTKWIDVDVGYNSGYSYAAGRGDFELLSLIKGQLHNTNICANPTNAMAQLANGKLYLEGGDKVHMSIDGIYCLHYEQVDGYCHNYNVKFCCPDNTSAMNSTKSDITTSMNSTEPTESSSWLGSITKGQSEIISTFVCIGSPIDVQWTKSPAGSTFLYELQNRDRTTNKIKQTSVQMLLPGEQLVKVTRMLSPSPDFCVTSTKISSAKNDITVEQVARIDQHRMNTVSRVIHKLHSKTVKLTFVDFE